MGTAERKGKGRGIIDLRREKGWNVPT